MCAEQQRRDDREPECDAHRTRLDAGCRVVTRKNNSPLSAVSEPTPIREARDGIERRAGDGRTPHRLQQRADVAGRRRRRGADREDEAAADGMSVLGHTCHSTRTVPAPMSRGRAHDDVRVVRIVGERERRRASVGAARSKTCATAGSIGSLNSSRMLVGLAVSVAVRRWLRRDQRDVRAGDGVEPNHRRQREGARERETTHDQREYFRFATNVRCGNGWKRKYFRLSRLSTPAPADQCRFTR